jgi:hypothetical protein
MRLSDETGPAHHARYTVPDWSHGYRLEDAAGALVVSAKYHDMFHDADAQRLAEICTALLQLLIGDGHNVSAALDYARHPKGEATESDVAKALWAFAYVAHRGPSSLAEAAIDAFHQLITRNATFESARASGYAVLGAANYLMRFPGAFQIKRFLAKQAAAVVEFCTDDTAKSPWIDRWDDADWPLAAQAVGVAAKRLADPALEEASRRLTAEIRQATADGTEFSTPTSGSIKEESPVTAAVYIDALGAAYRLSGEDDLIHSIRAAADWFLGANRLGVPLYDFKTGGCHDALTPSGLNRNQGTESTVFCLLAFLTLHRLASVEVADESHAAESPASEGA